MFMPQQLLSAALEVIINQALRLNSHDNHALYALKGKTLSLYLDELGFDLIFSINDFATDTATTSGSNSSINYINVLAHTAINERSETNSEAISDCSIKTSLKSLWQLKQEQQLTELIKQNKLDLLGDIKVAQQFATMIDNINIDWQSELAKHIGDIPTYQLGQLGQWLKKKGDFASKQISADASEWLIHEKRLLVTQYELNQFYQAIDTIEQDYQQLSERLTRINSFINK